MLERLSKGAYLLAARIAQTKPPTGGSGTPSTPPGTVTVPSNLPQGTIAPVLTTVINWGLSMAGGVAVLMLIVGGFVYITAAGDERKIERGKNIVKSAITGTIIILISAIIVNTINNALFSR